MNTVIRNPVSCSSIGEFSRCEHLPAPERFVSRNFPVRRLQRLGMDARLQKGGNLYIFEDIYTSIHIDIYIYIYINTYYIVTSYITSLYILDDIQLYIH